MPIAAMNCCSESTSISNTPNVCTSLPQGKWGIIKPTDLEIGNKELIRSNPDQKSQPWKDWKKAAMAMGNDNGERPWTEWEFQTENARRKPWVEWIKQEYLLSGGMPGTQPSQNYQGG